MNAPDLRLPPHSVEAEQSVLGGLMLQNDALDRVADIINEQDFYRADHRSIWRQITALINDNKPADVITVAEALDSRNQLDDIGGLAYLAAMAQNIPSAGNIRHYAEIMRKHARQRAVAAMAVELQAAAYDPLGRDAAEIVAEARAALDAMSLPSRSTWPQALDLTDMATRTPTPPEFIVEDWMPAGYATLLAGHGGIGKSGIALMLAACIGLGRPFYGLDTRQARVTYLSCEDRENVLHWRLSRIASYLGIGLDDLAGKLDVIDLVGQPTILWAKSPNGATFTPAYAGLEPRIRSSGSSVLIVDGIADVFDGNENARAEVKAFINSLLALIPANGAVLLLGHVNRMSASSSVTSEGYSGSTGWNNSVRARWYLYPETRSSDDEIAERTGDLILELQKNNLGPTNRSMRFRWSDDQGLYMGHLIGDESNFDRRQRDRQEQDGILAALASSDDPVPAASTGNRTAYHVLGARAQFPKTLLGGKPEKRRFWRHVEALRAMGAITESSIRRSDRHLVRVLALTDKACGDVGNA